jgi:hypothetical protein
MIEFNIKTKVEKFTQNEIKFMGKLYDYIFDKGMKKALDRGMEHEYMEDKLLKCLTNPKIKKLFKTFSFDSVDLGIVQKAVHYVPIKKVTKEWLRFHRISLVGQRVEDNKIVGLFDCDILFNLKVELQKKGEENVIPISKWIANRVMQTQNRMSSLRQWKNVFPKEYKPLRETASIF